MPTRTRMASQLSDAAMEAARGEGPLWVIPELRG
jgi:hypothetical protein